jgi:hypothetical protein
VRQIAAFFMRPAPDGIFSIRGNTALLIAFIRHAVFPPRPLQKRATIAIEAGVIPPANLGELNGCSIFGRPFCLCVRVRTPAEKGAGREVSYHSTG